MYEPTMNQKEPNWCHSLWHKWFHGSIVKEHDFNDMHIAEHFCRKCGKKTGGYTAFYINSNLTPKD